MRKGSNPSPTLEFIVCFLTRWFLELLTFNETPKGTFPLRQISWKRGPGVGLKPTMATVCKLLGQECHRRPRVQTLARTWSTRKGNSLQYVAWKLLLHSYKISRPNVKIWVSHKRVTRRVIHLQYVTEINCKLLTSPWVRIETYLNARNKNVKTNLRVRHCSQRVLNCSAQYVTSGPKAHVKFWGWKTALWSAALDSFGSCHQSNLAHVTAVFWVNVLEMLEDLDYSV